MSKRKYDTHAEAAAHDIRFEDVKYGIEAGRIKSLHDVFQRLPKTVVATAIGKKVDRFAIMEDNPDRFYVGDVKDLSIIFGVTVFEMFAVVYNKSISVESHEEG